MDAIKENEERTRKQARDLTAENEKRSTELKVARENFAELERRLVNDEKNKLRLAVSSVTRESESSERKDTTTSSSFERESEL